MLEKENINFEVEDSHFRCFPHILNLCVQDILALLKCSAHIEENQDEESSSSVIEESDDGDEDEDEDKDDDPDIFEEEFAEIVVKIRKLFTKIRRIQKIRT